MSPYPYTDAAHPATAIRTASGLLVNLLDLKPEDIRMSDIATSLAHQNRYTGHCPLQPTVAQHSLAVEHIAETYLMPDEVSGDDEMARLQLSRAALMHDAQEAYVSDLSAPAKRALRGLTYVGHACTFDELERAGVAAVVGRFDCSAEGWEALIHEADVLAWAYEAAYANWSPSARVPLWLACDTYVQRCYGDGDGFRIDDDGGEAAFLRRARALGMHDDA